MAQCNCIRCDASIRVLELTPPVSFAEIASAYRDLAKVWHPDRFEHDPRLRKRAEERFKDIQAAYTALREHQHAESTPRQDDVDATPDAASESSGTRKSSPTGNDEEFAKKPADAASGLTWNWTAFYLTVVWAIMNDLRGATLVCFGVLLLTFTGHVPLGLPLLLMPYMGARGNSMHYKKVALKDHWALW